MENLEHLVDSLRADEDMRSKLEACVNNEEAANAALAQAGYAVTVGDLEEYAASKISELSDEELYAVAGGSDAADAVSATFAKVVGFRLSCWPIEGQGMQAVR